MPLFSKVEVEARENLYKEANTGSSQLVRCTRFARTGIPILFVGFQLCYWSIGLAHIYASGVPLDIE